MVKQKRAAVYCRVSSEESADSGLSIEVQEKACSKAAKDLGYGITKVFKDEGFSAFSKKPRPDYLDMLSRLREFDCIFVLRLDRFGRREREIHNAVGDIIEAGVGWYSVNERFDLSTPMGRAAFSVSATFAELWSGLTQERVREALEESASQGRKLGFAPYGYSLPQPKAIIVPDPNTAPVARRIFTAYAEGESIIQICRNLQGDGIPSPKGKPVWYTGIIRGMLCRQTYIGKVVHGRTGQVFDGLHEAIIDRDLWDRVQMRLAANRGVPARQRGTSLSPILRCGLCGSRLHVLLARGTNRNYYCQQRQMMAERHEPIFIADWIAEGYIWLIVEQMALPEAEAAFRESSANAVDVSGAELRCLRDERQSIESEIKYNLKVARETQLPIHLFAEANAPLQDRLAEIAREIIRLSDIQPFTRGDFMEALTEIRAGGYEQQRHFLNRLFAKIEVHRDRLVFWPVGIGEPLAVRRQQVGGRMDKTLRLQIVSI